MHSSPSDLTKFIDRYHLARSSAIKELSARGTSGLELEWNMVDEEFRPLQTVGAGPDERSFVDVFKEDFAPEWLQSYIQLEVFHWMIEWVTNPYYSPVLTVYESRLLEAMMINLMRKAGLAYEERLYQMHGNSLSTVQVDHNTIPGGWGLAKRRYLQKCIDLYGSTLANAGLHSNVSLPETLLSWDFMHLPASERVHHHLDEYKNEIYIESTRLMRAFAALFIATSASTPFRAEMRGDQQVVLLTEFDSNRNLTFPYPEGIDVPDLYRSHRDYIRLSNELVQAGIRFGNNNWTPVRARSFAEPVERLIDITSDQLHEIYGRGLYSSGETTTYDQLVQDIEFQNLLARIDIPMARVEIRTDDGGHPLDLDIANLALKELLLIQFYADRRYARAFRYDREDILRAHRNEIASAKSGLDATLEHPLTGKPVQGRGFLRSTLDELRPLAEGLGWWDLLHPLDAMAEGAPNTAKVMRERIRSQIGEDGVVPTDLLCEMAVSRENHVAEDVERIANDLPTFGIEGDKLQELFWRARNDARREPEAPIRFSASAGSILYAEYPDKTTEILNLAQHLIRIPTVSNVPPDRQRLHELDRCGTFISDYLRNAGLEVKIYEKGRFPAILAHFPGLLEAPVMLSGHFDVVEPEPDDSQFEPQIEGDFLIGRGAADMKTVVATYLVWMKDTAKRGFPYPGINLLLVGNEEIGEGEPAGTPHVLADLADRYDYQPQLLVAGERTGEQGHEIYGQVCVENRGLIRFELIAHGVKGHTGIASELLDVSSALNKARIGLMSICEEHLTLKGEGSWYSQLKFPYTHFGERGIYNVAADEGILGVEIRIIPEDSVENVLSAISEYCERSGLELSLAASEAGIVCNLNNIYLVKLLEAVRQISGEEPVLGKKLPGTSARFAPEGQGIVWGQSGLGPHSADERHFIPSIKPYYDMLNELGVSMSA